jgi:3'(2'), 5'-bisphosphate nucleotidase
MMFERTPEVKFAMEAVRRGSLLASQVQAETLPHTMTKEDRSPVTIADYACQALVAQMLLQAFPSDALLAEEDADKLRKPEGAEVLEQVTQFVKRFEFDATPAAVCEWLDCGKSEPATRFWTLDPIDGTKGFLRSDQYAVALALVVEGEVQVAVMGCPNLSDGYRPDPFGTGTLVVAVRGQGAWFTQISIPGVFEQLQVSYRSDPSKARLLRSFEAEHTNERLLDELQAALGIKPAQIRMDSQAKYAVLAAGKGDVILRPLPASNPVYREKIWDIAAGALVVEEAGGCVSDLRGDALDFTQGRVLSRNEGVLSTNGLLHPAFIKALRKLDTAPLF